MASRANNSKHSGLLRGFQMHNWTENNIPDIFQVFMVLGHTVINFQNTKCSYCVFT